MTDMNIKHKHNPSSQARKKKDYQKIEAGNGDYLLQNITFTNFLLTVHHVSVTQSRRLMRPP